LGTDIAQPNGASKLCLGCHDGSYTAFTSGGANATYVFGVEDLKATHPISFTYDTALAAKTLHHGRVKDPATATSGLGGTIAQDLLDAKSKVQCTSCHDVHTTGIGDKMLRLPYGDDDGTLCMVCHDA
jgi:predicted CXXCH cytochrome family protein